ncbi:hypothetical protein MC885_010897, partial [Smutsia gigantea]
PVRRLARLGEQLLTEVKALRKVRLRRAKASSTFRERARCAQQSPRASNTTQWAEPRRRMAADGGGWWRLPVRPRPSHVRARLRPPLASRCVSFEPGCGDVGRLRAAAQGMLSSAKALGLARPSDTSMGPQARCCSPAALRRRLPILAWLPDYSLQWLKMDFIAGLSVGLTVIPQALAYAEVAGLPPQYGLYSAFMGCFVYFFLGTSRDVTLGPTAIMSLLVSFYTFHAPAYAVLLAFLSGCIQLAMGFLHLGFLLDFISCPVIKGFTSAATITIGFGQIKNLLGLQNIPRQFFLQVYYTFRNIGETRTGDATLGLVCMALLLALKLMRDHVPPVHPEMPPGVRLSLGLVWTATTARNALVVSFAALVAYSFEVTGYQPFVLTGEIVKGLPPIQTPPFSVTTANGTASFTEMVQDMGAGLAVVPLMGLLESIAVAKSFASQNNYRIDTNQELLAIGLTNVLGSFVSSYPVTGSFGRTAVNAQSGVCTPAGGLVTGILVLLSLDFLTSLFSYIPKSALAAVIIMAVAPLFDARIVWTLWRLARTYALSVERLLEPRWQVGGGRSAWFWELSLPDAVRAARKRASFSPLALQSTLDQVHTVLTSLCLPESRGQLGLQVSRQLSPGREGFPASGTSRGWRGLSAVPAPGSPGPDLLPLCVTFLLCFWEIQYGILAGALVSILILLHSVARPRIQVSEGPVLVLQPASGLHFPAVEALREVILNQALEAAPPRCTILECTHVCSIDYTVVLGLGELLEDFHRQGVPVLRVLLSADLKGAQYFSSLEEAENCLTQEPGTQPYNISEDSVPEHKIPLLKA